MKIYYILSHLLVTSAAKELHKGKIYVKLKPKMKRKMTQEEIIQYYRNKIPSNNGMIISVEKVDDFDTGTTTVPVQVVIKR